MADRFDIEDRWPELFESLSSSQRSSVRQALAASWHEGWEPNHESVANLVDVTTGAIDQGEYLRRARNLARRTASLSTVG